MTVEELAKETNFVVAKIARKMYKVMPVEALKHPDEDYFTSYGTKQSVREVLEIIYEDKNKTTKE